MRYIIGIGVDRAFIFLPESFKKANPFVVSLSNHERATLLYVIRSALRQAQGERLLVLRL